MSSTKKSKKFVCTVSTTLTQGEFEAVERAVQEACPGTAMSEVLRASLSLMLRVGLQRLTFEGKLSSQLIKELEPNSFAMPTEGGEACHA